MFLHEVLDITVARVTNNEGETSNGIDGGRLHDHSSYRGVHSGMLRAECRCDPAAHAQKTIRNGKGHGRIDRNCHRPIWHRELNGCMRP